MIPPATNWPQHRNSSLANTTQLWYGLDNLDNFEKNCANPDRLKDLRDHNWIDATIEYKFNGQGFRSIEFDLTVPSGLAIGCSFTQGVGVGADDTWPAAVSKHLNMPIWNLGVGGASLDTVFRLLDYWLPILKPKFVLHASTFPTRFELCNQHGQFVVYLPNSSLADSPFYKEWIAYPVNSQLNARKNLLAIDNLCNIYNIPLVTLPIEQHFKFDNAGRDLVHSGSTAHAVFANKIIHYLKDLYDHNN